LDEPGRAGNLVVLFLAIGLVSWLTMARVVRGRCFRCECSRFVDAARATGLPEWRIFLFHLLPNLAGPIIVYATLTIPLAILQESFLAFSGSAFRRRCLPGALSRGRAYAGAVAGSSALVGAAVSLYAAVPDAAEPELSGDGLRDLIDPKREAAKL